MKHISFYIIHNNSEDRFHLRNKLKNLANKFNIDLIEIYKQRKNLKIKYSLKYKLMILRSFFLRCFYDLIHKKDFSLNFCFLILSYFFKLIKYTTILAFKNKNEVIKSYSHIKIESLVTQKHIRAWKHFIKSEKEILIVFEDDAICKKDTEVRLKNLLEKLENFNLDNIFIDLAGGYKTKQIIPLRKIKKLEDGFLIVEGIYTNTACSYLINRNLILKLFEEYKKSKLNNSLPIDHLINKLGLRINRNLNTSSIHYSKPLFTHGSFEGNIKSWQIN